MNKYTIDFTECKYMHYFHKAIRKGLKFPYHYGENMDAFWDCIKDLGKYEFCIEILGLESLSKDFDEEINVMINLLKEYREKYNPYLVIKVIYNGEDILL